MTRKNGKRLAAVAPEQSAQDELHAEPTLDRDIQARIGDHLRAMYDELLQQPVPDRFRELLGRLDSRGKGAEQNQ